MEDYSECLEFKYWDTQWYSTLAKEQFYYKYSLLNKMIIGSFVIPFIFFALNFIEKNHQFMLSYFIGSVVMFLFYLIFLKFKKLSLFINLSLAIYNIAFALVLFLPGAKALIMLLLFIYPLIVYQLKGIKKGNKFILIFIGIYLVYYVFFLVFQLKGDFSLYRAVWSKVIPFSAFALVTVISYFSEKRHEDNFEKVIQKLLVDETTGLPNKEVLLNSLAVGRKYMVAIISIQNFSDLTGLFGYEIVENVIRFSCRKIQELEQEYDFYTFRLLHNEFGLLFDLRERECTEKELDAILQEIWRKISLHELMYEKLKIRILYRIGAICTEYSESENIMSKADIALKKAEKTFSNIVLFHEDFDTRDKVIDSVVKYTELADNIENNTLMVEYMPICEAGTGKVLWFEALLRVKNQKGEYGTVYPYLKIARTTGLYNSLTDFVLDDACKLLQKVDHDISINISTHDIIREDILPLVKKHIDQLKGRPGKIIFEILESDELIELNKCLDFILQVRELGCLVALDDFGAGYSNFDLMLNLPFDIIKIDGQLIKKLNKDLKAKNLVESICTFTKKNSLKTVAEFVDNNEVWNIIKEMDIDFVQGYHFGKPALYSFPEA